MKVFERCIKAGVIPVVVIENSKQADQAANALLEGGIDVMEVTLRTPAGLDSIRSISKNCSGILVGAGTVTTLDQCKASVDAGASFIVSPGFGREIVKWCVKNEIAVLPGCVTPTEIMEGLEYGISTFKFFPANIYGGLKAMKALSEPFGGIGFIPTGGINAENLKEYISAPFVKAVGGSWVCTKADISGGNFSQIVLKTREAADLVLQVREEQLRAKEV